jgi:hypothetical protein
VHAKKNILIKKVCGAKVLCYSLSGGEMLQSREEVRYWIIRVYLALESPERTKQNIETQSRRTTGRFWEYFLCIKHTYLDL